MYLPFIAFKKKRALCYLLSSLISLIVAIITSEFSDILIHSIQIKTYDYPKSSNFHRQLINNIYLNQLNVSRIENRFQIFADQDKTSSRSYNSQSGLESALAIYDILFEYFTRDTDIFNVTLIRHSWLQPSIVFRINPKPQDVNPDKIIVVGCHIDTVNFDILSFASKPAGIDDDLSGVVTLLESIDIITTVLSTYSNNDYQQHLVTPIEFHFYSGEEFGTLGSHEIIKQYHKLKIEILAMIEQDMTGYTNSYKANNLESRFGLVTDYASPTLNNYIKEIIQNYCEITYSETKIKYGSSDHISSLLYGYPASYVLESEIEYSNPYIHSNKDTLDHIDFNHVMQHVKLVLGFSLELSMNTISQSKKNDYVKFSPCDFVILMLLNETCRFFYCVIQISYIIGLASFLISENKVFKVDKETSSTDRLLEEGKVHRN